MSDHSVAIVGGGMVGLTVACLLSKQRLDIKLIDGGPAPVWDENQHDLRVSAINVASRRILDAIGVWETVADKRVAPVRTMEVWDSNSAARIRFDARDSGRDVLAWIVENSLVCSEMHQRLTQNYHVQIHQGAAVSGVEASDQGIRLGLANRTDAVEATLAIAADGGNSTLRSLAGIAVEEQDYGQDAIVATVETERSHQDTAWQCFTPTGPVALLPFGNHRCSLVWSVDRDAAIARNSDDPKQIAEGLNSLFGDKLGQLQISGPTARFPLWQRHATAYSVERLALIGDAAHTTHPLAGLGANIGLLDAAALAETIQRASDLGRAPSSATALRRYARWRRGENAMVLDTMHAFKLAFGREDDDPVDQLLGQLRAGGFAIANRTAPLKRRLAAHAMGLAGDLPAICRAAAG